MSKNSCRTLLYILYDRRGGFLGGALEWFQRSYIIVMPCLCTKYKPSLYKWRCKKKKDLTQYRNISDIFLKNDYRTESRQKSRWYIYINIVFVHKTFSFRKHFGTVWQNKLEQRNFITYCLWCINISQTHWMYLNHRHTRLHSMQSLNLTNIEE